MSYVTVGETVTMGRTSTTVADVKHAQLLHLVLDTTTVSSFSTKIALI